MSNDEHRHEEPATEQAGLAAEDLDAQAAVELPDREAMTVIQPEPIFGIQPVSQQPLDQIPVWRNSETAGS